MGKYLHFGGLTFGRKIKSMESGSDMKFAHLVGLDIVKVISERDSIYFIIAINLIQLVSLIHGLQYRMQTYIHNLNPAVLIQAL